MIWTTSISKPTRPIFKLLWIFQAQESSQPHCRENNDHGSPQLRFLHTAGGDAQAKQPDWWLVGSSSRRISGFLSKILHSTTLRCSPPESTVLPLNYESIPARILKITCWSIVTSPENQCATNLTPRMIWLLCNPRVDHANAVRIIR